MSSFVRPVLALIVLVCVFTPMPVRTSYAQNHSATPPTAESPREQLRSLFDEEWQYSLRTNPEGATSLGDPRFNDRLSDNSPQFFQSDLEQRRKFLARFETIDPATLPPQDALSRQLMIRALRQQIEGAQFKNWEMPVDQMNGPHLELPDLVVLTPFNTAADYRNYLARLNQLPRFFNQVIANMRQGMQDGLMPPRYLLEKVAAEADDIAAKTGETSPFAAPLKTFPSSVSAPEQKQLREGVLAAINDQVLPAYKRFADFVRTDYAPHGRTDPGVWSLPDGAARYRFEIRAMTTTDLTPEQIHEIGLKQVDETEAQMLALAHKLGFKDLATLNDHIKNDRSFYATSGQQILDLYANYARNMEPELPKLFGHLPKSKLTVIPMKLRAPKMPYPLTTLTARRMVPAPATSTSTSGTPSTASL